MPCSHWVVQDYSLGNRTTLPESQSSRICFNLNATLVKHARKACGLLRASTEARHQDANVGFWITTQPFFGFLCKHFVHATDAFVM